MTGRMRDGTIDGLALDMMRVAKRVAAAIRDAPEIQRDARVQIALRDCVRQVEARVIANQTATARRRAARGSSAVVLRSS